MLYIMRHGRTDYNKLHKLQGRTDTKLNEEGRAMARAAHDECSNVHLDICYSSPLVRARETAEIVLDGKGVPIVTDDRLLEMSFGDYEGMAYSFQEPGGPLDVIFQRPEMYTHSIGGAETFEELFARSGSFLRDIALPEVDRGRDVLIVGHGALNSAIICQIKHTPISDFWSNGLEQCKLLRLL